MKNTGELIKGFAEKEELLLKFSYRYRSQNLWEMTQGFHGQWERDYCLEQKRRLLQHQREASRTADEGVQIAGGIPALLLAAFC